MKPKSHSYKVAVDFDGTISEHRYPDLGKPVPGAFEWMKAWQDEGAKLIMWTMRSGIYLEDAVKFCADHGVAFDAVNEGIGDRDWTDSPKCHAHRYVDDNAAGCPLIDSKEMGGRQMVDWEIVGPMIMEDITGKYGEFNRKP